MKSFLISLTLLLGISAAPKAVFAHAVETKYEVSPESVEIQSVFSTGEFFKDAPIVVYAPNAGDEPWLEAKTDEDGKFVFEPDPTILGEWAIEIGEGGHWDRLKVPVTDQGIELEEMIVTDGHIPHHHLQLAGQFMVAGAVVAGLGNRLLRRKES